MRVLILLVALTACMPQKAETGQRAASEKAMPPKDELLMCDAAPVQKFIGKKRNEAIGADILRLSNSDTIRWIYPNQPVTMDYGTARVNVEMDKDGVIKAINCG